MELEKTTPERRLLARAAQKRRPASGTLELSPLCNLNCDMCYVRLTPAELAAKGRLRTAEEWLSLAEQMEHADVLFLLLTGGEPLLYPGFRQLYVRLKRMGFILSVNTNGTLIDEDWADFFTAQKPRCVNITLYGADRSAYERLCHAPDGFDRTMRGIRLLRERGIDVRVGASVTRKNRADVGRIAEIACECGAALNVDPYMTPAVRERTKTFEEQARLAPEEAACVRVESMRRELGEARFRLCADAIVQAVKQDMLPKSEDMSCLAGRCSFAVNWQSQMRPCVMLEQPSVPVFDVGFEEAWRTVSRGVEAIRISPKCASCALRPLCHTCAASAYWETGDCGGVPEYLCRYAKETARLLEK